MEFSLGSPTLWLTFFVGALIVALLYDNSSTFRYRFKFAVYILTYSIVSTCIIPVGIFRPKDVRNILLAVPFLRPISKLLGVRWEVSGREILAKDFPCVVTCNHQSILDIAVIVELWPTMKKCACIAKKEILYVFPFGLAAWVCGTTYINRRDSGDSQMKLNTTAEKIRKDKTKMWIFPEGTRSTAEKLLPFKKGAFHIALMNKLPIVPVVVSPYYFLNYEKKVFDSGIVKVKVLDPIDTSSYKYPEDVPKLLDRCYTVMDLEFQKMKKELHITPATKAEAANYTNYGNGIKNTNHTTKKINDSSNGLVHQASEELHRESRSS